MPPAGTLLHVGRKQVGERRLWARPWCVNVKFLGVLGVLQVKGDPGCRVPALKGTLGVPEAAGSCFSCSPVATGGRWCSAQGS